MPRDAVSRTANIERTGTETKFLNIPGRVGPDTQIDIVYYIVMRIYFSIIRLLRYAKRAHAYIPTNGFDIDTYLIVIHRS